MGEHQGMDADTGDTVRLGREAYDELRGQAPQPVGDGLRVGAVTWEAHVSLACPESPPVRVATLVASGDAYMGLVHGDNPAQLPALLFDATGDPWPLVHYFPAAGILTDNGRAEHFAQIGALAAHPHLDLQLIGERRQNLTAQLPASARWIVAGHIVEVLGQRSDVLTAFLAQPRHFRLYTSGAAFEQDGGIAGGDYDARRERVQLGLSRVFEGFGERTPGVAPVLHELGHMLDAFEPATGRMGGGRGLLPGLAPADGPLFDAEARRRFLSGKALEVNRYAAIRRGRTGAGAQLPIGHPYVFQNDGEFIAGYLELFLRTPNRMAALNPDLFAGFARVLRQDPRPAWPEDFAFYVQENEKAYRAGAPLAPAGISVPAT